MTKIPNTVNDLFDLSVSDIISKKDLFSMIQYSKVKDSKYWSGEDNIIGNTPQQGINWVGEPPRTKAVIIKSKTGIYDFDGWSNKEKVSFTYSFKARNGNINLKEKANRVLIEQPKFNYPILLFNDAPNGWRYEGKFSVIAIEKKYVVLKRKHSFEHTDSQQDELIYEEGGRKYTAHLIIERNKEAINCIKNSRDWKCEICGLNFNTQYGFKYIEAHHKKPIASFSDKHQISISDLALLCPNCHKAVHLFMKSSDMKYEEIAKKIASLTI
ncbi:HNH endonuclease [Maridesulfovibrio sp. FT414]|uniref:HNH endonuclease n=1 Tax=Maridesulfovibrio sp. FT414 TaxID=2979469 RepID=UPI003D804E19